MLIFGVAFLVIVSFFALFLANPPAGYRPGDDVDRRGEDPQSRAERDRFNDIELPPSQMLRTVVFWRIWLLYFIGAGAGLMVIGSVAGMAKTSLGENAFLAVAILAIGNASGRIVAGLLADRYGRQRTLNGVFGIQALMMFAAVPIVSAAQPSALLLVSLATVIGFNYGANLALFPTFSKDLWGMKNFGVNYGLLFTAWGVGGFVMSRVSQVIRASSDSYTNAFVFAGVLLLIGVLVVTFICDEKEARRRMLARQAVADT